MSTSYTIATNEIAAAAVTIASTASVYYTYTSVATAMIFQLLPILLLGLATYNFADVGTIISATTVCVAFTHAAAPSTINSFADRTTTYTTATYAIAEAGTMVSTATAHSSSLYVTTAGAAYIYYSFFCCQDYLIHYCYLYDC